jgi:hypothetical protein
MATSGAAVAAILFVFLTWKIWFTSASPSSTSGLDHSWRKSSKSLQNGDCIEVRLGINGVEVRDSKDPEGPVLAIDTKSWRSFVADPPEM